LEGAPYACFADTPMGKDHYPAGEMVDETLARYACWISSQAALASGMEQKLTALSRRTAAEFRKAEQEHLDLAARLSSLEACCCRAGLMHPADVRETHQPGPAMAQGDGPLTGQPLPESSQLEKRCRELVEEMMARELRSLENVAKRHAEMEADMGRICEEFQAKLGTTCWQEVQRATDEIRCQTSQFQATLRDEVRIVHNEVMSLDARVALLEEQPALAPRFGGRGGFLDDETQEVLKSFRCGLEGRAQSRSAASSLGPADPRWGGAAVKQPSQQATPSTSGHTPRS